MVLRFPHSDRYGSIYILLHVNIPYPFMSAAFVKDSLIPIVKFWLFFKHHVFIGMWVNVRVLDSIPLNHMSAFMTVLSCFMSIAL